MHPAAPLPVLGCWRSLRSGSACRRATRDALPSTFSQPGPFASLWPRSACPAVERSPGACGSSARCRNGKGDRVEPVRSVQRPECVSSSLQARWRLRPELIRGIEVSWIEPDFGLLAATDMGDLDGVVLKMLARPLGAGP